MSYINIFKVMTKFKFFCFLNMLKFTLGKEIHDSKKKKITNDHNKKKKNQEKWMLLDELNEESI